VETTDVYVVEDDPRLLASCVSVFEQEGFTVRGYHRAEAALEAIEGDVPRLVVTDQQMPDLFGDELMREVRARLRDRAPPFLLITGADIPRNVLAGFDGVLYKPFRLDDLVMEARTLGLRRRPSVTRLKSPSQIDDDDERFGSG
jgi:DNA-binding response OmpR family regulator